MKTLQDEVKPTLDVCEFCAPAENFTEDKLCPSSSRRGFICTREKGHRGDHVACGTSEHMIDTWRGGRDEEDKESTR